MVVSYAWWGGEVRGLLGVSKQGTKWDEGGERWNGRAVGQKAEGDVGRWAK